MESTREGKYALVGLLVVQVIVGYEWLLSGLAKVVRGGFPQGLEGELTEKSEAVGGWFGSFLEGTAIPNATLFGYLVEVGELLIGAALIGAALVWFFRWGRLSSRGKYLVLLATILGAAFGVFLAIALHLANAAPHPWFIPWDAFDEAVDLDSVLPAIQVVLIVVSIATWRAVRKQAVEPSAIGRDAEPGSPPTSQPVPRHHPRRPGDKSTRAA